MALLFIFISQIMIEMVVEHSNHKHTNNSPDRWPPHRSSSHWTTYASHQSYPRLAKPALSGYSSSACRYSTSSPSLLVRPVAEPGSTFSTRVLKDGCSYYSGDHIFVSLHSCAERQLLLLFGRSYLCIFVLSCRKKLLLFGQSYLRIFVLSC